MNPELQDKLTEIFPWFDVYVECGDGWQWIILDMLREIDDLYFNVGREVDIEILQVKEKWGFLNVYHNSYHNDVNEIITRYTELSKSTCEICGAEGKLLRDEYWVTVRCEECRI